MVKLSWSVNSGPSRLRQKNTAAIKEIEESNFAFQIFDQVVASSPKAYQYKMTRVDLTESDLYSERAEYFWAGFLEILTYDGQTEALERVEALAPYFSVELFDVS